MAHPYGSGGEGPWGDRWRDPRREREDERFGSEREDRDLERGWEGRRSERRWGGEPGWRGEDRWRGGEHGRGGGAYGRDEWSERSGYGEPGWYGRDERHREPWEREEGRWEERRPRRGYERWATSESGRRWPGGVTGAEAGQPYGGGFFGTAYALYAGRRERGGSEPERAGRGPKGYKRSDERIHEDVCERIARAGVDADDVEVKVENGEVTLSGSVHRRDEKRWIEDLAEEVWGVHEVHNQLRVARPAEGAQGEGKQGEGSSWPSGH